LGNPLVSLVCPTWNRPQYLAHAVKLFQAQTYRDCELIVVDDSDPDKRPNLSGVPRVRHIKLGDKLSLGEKHNIGHAMAQGEILGFHDDDDWISPRRVIRQIEPLILGTAQIVGFKRNVVLSAGDPVRWWKIEGRGNWIGNGATNLRLPIHDGSALYLRSVLKTGARFPHRTMNEKVDFLNAAVAGGATWTVIPNADLFVYVRHGANTWKYSEALAHVSVAAPYWFPDSEMEFYRTAKVSA
jgi:glycosyltransferase involved in cell wall biosynthesis